MSLTSNIKYSKICPHYTINTLKSDLESHCESNFNYFRSCFASNTMQLKGWLSTNLDKIDELTKLLDQGNINDFIQAFKCIFNQLKNNHTIELPYIKSITIFLVSKVIGPMSTNFQMCDEFLIEYIICVQTAECRNTLFELMDEIIMSIEDNKRCSINIKNESDYVNYLKHYIQDHYQEDISLSSLASHLHISRCHLSRVFKKETGYNFIDYLTNYRIKKAVSYLKKSNMMIYEISEKVGYNDPAYFCKAFKNVTGLSPSQYILNSKADIV